MKQLLFAFITMSSLCSAQPTYQEVDGRVIIEAETTTSPLGQWIKETSLPGYTGSGYLEFNGNDYTHGPASSPLKYTFRINQSGLYYLHLRSARETRVIDGEKRKDVSNDCYVRVEGDYEAGPNAGDDHGKDALLSLLKKNTKFYGGADGRFAWAFGPKNGGRLDPGGHKNKRVAIYNFKAGETYTLVVHGRSRAYKLDRIVFALTSLSDTETHNLSQGETLELSEDSRYTYNSVKDIPTLESGDALIAPPPGRLAIVADGNSPDPDDIGATAVIFGILNKAGLNDRLVHLSHSCDLDPFRNKFSKQSIDETNELRRQNKLHELSGQGIAFYGPYPNLVDYYNCRTEQTAAVNDLRDAINASTATDPLWIIEAGEPDLIGYALQAADVSKTEHVHVVSHHPANDNSGDFFTWQQILDFGVTEHQIGDQNKGLQTATSAWDWAKDHREPGIAWIWDNLKYAEQDGVVGFQTNKFDPSDAGMIYWWITGASFGGNRNSTPAELKALLLYDPSRE